MIFRNWKCFTALAKMRQVSEEKQVIVHAPDPFVFKGIKKNPVYIKEKHVIDIVRGGPFDL